VRQAIRLFLALPSIAWEGGRARLPVCRTNPPRHHFTLKGENDERQEGLGQGKRDGPWSLRKTGSRAAVRHHGLRPSSGGCGFWGRFIDAGRGVRQIRQSASLSHGPPPPQSEAPVAQSEVATGGTMRASRGRWRSRSTREFRQVAVTPDGATSTSLRNHIGAGKAPRVKATIRRSSQRR
jgi:hypothetical protein